MHIIHAHARQSSNPDHGPGLTAYYMIVLSGIFLYQTMVSVLAASTNIFALKFQPGAILYSVRFDENCFSFVRQLMLI